MNFIWDDLLQSLHFIFNIRVYAKLASVKLRSWIVWIADALLEMVYFKNETHCFLLVRKADQDTYQRSLLHFLKHSELFIFVNFIVFLHFSMLFHHSSNIMDF